LSDGTVTDVAADDDELRTSPLAGGAGRGAFLAFRFAVELATLAVLAWTGASVSASLPVRIILAIGLPVLMAVAWGLIMAPTAKWRLREAPRLVAELAIFLGSAAGLAASGHVLAAVIYAVIAVAGAALTRVITPGA
jgi:hypothetical protein